MAAKALELAILPIVAWVVYELCYCPTTCGVQTVRGHPCRKPTFGRLYACRAEPSHRALKTDALLRLIGLRHGRPPVAERSPDPSPRAANHEIPPGSPSMEPRQQGMLILTVIGVIAGVAQTVLTVIK